MHKHIAIIGINYAPEVTGCAPYNTDLAEKLAAEGHKVTVVAGLPHYPEWRIAPDFAAKGSHTEMINGVEVRRVRISVPKKMNAISRGLYELSFLLNGWWHSRDIRPDIVLGVSPAWAGTAIAAIIKKRGAVMKVLVQDLMAAAASQSNISGGGAVTRIVEALEGWSLRKADSVGVITEQFKTRVLAFGVAENKIVVTPNYAQSHVVAMDRDECREFWGWPKEDFIVMHTGNMGLKQDLGNVIEAARIAEKSRPDIKFYLVGDGSQKALLMEQAEGLKNVVFKDLVSNDEYSILLGAADVLLINESPDQVDMSLPSKLTSYLAASRMLVAACSTGGSTFQYLKSFNAILVEPDNADLLLQKIFSTKSSEIPLQNSFSNDLETRLIWIPAMISEAKGSLTVVEDAN